MNGGNGLWTTRDKNHCTQGKRDSGLFLGNSRERQAIETGATERLLAELGLELKGPITVSAYSKGKPGRTRAERLSLVRTCS